MRIRITFSKQGALRYSSHLDLHKLWERATRRADLPLPYSQGFHPQPKLSIASALPLGFSSRCEILDMRLNEELSPDEISVRLKDNLPGGIQILDLEGVDDGAPALQTQIASAEYEVKFFDPVDRPELTRRVSALMNSQLLPRERRGKAYDLRPLIESISVTADSNDRTSMEMTLSAREGATGRPEEVLDALGIPADSTHIERIRLIFQN